MTTPSAKGVRRATTFLGIAALLGFVAVVPGSTQVYQEVAEEQVIIDEGSEGTRRVIEQGGETVGPSRSGLECNAGKNGGDTDIGVTATSIALASTIVKTGPGSSFLADSPTGMQAVATKVNSAGGVCGRLLNMTLRDDGWDAQRGLQFLKNFINEQKYFAFPVVPSSEGLTAAIEAGIISKEGIPVVGSDGMLRQQYEDEWVWPVATATESTMRVMAKFGYDEGARCFGIVYDKFYRFGKEGAEAFRQYVKAQKGARMCADVGILPAQASYGSEIQRFNSACNGKCEFVAMLLEPGTALTWINGRPEFGSLYTSGAQTLFNSGFATDCGKSCGGMLVWTGYNPPIGNLAGLPEVREYVNDVRAVDPTADTSNQFLEGAYFGMKIFVEALRRVGPELTRERLQAVLNSEKFKTDLASTLSWGKTARHANCRAQAFSMVVAQGSFAGFKNMQTGFIADPVIGC